MTVLPLLVALLACEPVTPTGTDDTGTPDTPPTDTGTTPPTETGDTQDTVDTVDTVDTEPTDTEPTDTEPTDTEPTDTEPTDTEPTDTEPTDTEPTDTDTGGTGSLLTWYVPAGDPWTLAEISSNLSGLTWNTDTQTYMMVRDGNRLVHEYDASFTHLREISLDGVTHSDLEDISYLGLKDGVPEYAMVAEDGTMVIGTIPDDGSTNVDVSTWDEITYSPEPANFNKGGEGVAYDPVTETFWVCVEKDPMTVYTFARPAAGSDVSWDVDLAVTEAFDAETQLGFFVTDISSCMYDSRTDQLLMLSHESGVLLDVALDGTVIDSLTVDLDLTGSDKPEGVTLNDDQDLVLGGENNDMRVYSYTGP